MKPHVSIILSTAQAEMILKSMENLKNVPFNKMQEKTRDSIIAEINHALISNKNRKVS